MEKMLQKSQCGLIFIWSRSVVLKVGEIAPLVAILKGKWVKIINH